VQEIETMWNESKGKVNYKCNTYTLVFVIKGYLFLNLERVAFLNLCGEKRTLERI
jgi:hypothetical protein